MLTSEEEAKGRWCPFTRLPFHLGTEITAVNRHPYEQQQQDTCCRGSACAAWRWQGWKTVGHISIAQDPKEENREGPRLGFCGLAGEPSPYGPR